MSLYEQNLQALFKKDPELASQLFAIQSNEKFEVFVDEKDPLNVNIANSHDKTVLYEGVPIQQIQEELEVFSQKYKRYPFVYFYGFANGVFFSALLQNELMRRVVVVEPEIELIYIALNFNDFAKDIESGRLKIVLSKEIDFAKAAAIFLQPEAKIFAKTYAFHLSLPYYEAHFSEDIVRVNTLFVQALEHAVRGTGNNSIDALTGLQHHIANVEKMVQTPTTLDLIKNGKNSETAIIVSTGPSLKKQLPFLKEIHQYVTVLCIDASLPILEKEGIKPDIVFSLERVIETARFYQETSAAFQEGIIFAVTSIAHPGLFESIKGGVLQVSMRPLGYTRYFGLDDYGYLGIGMSAANMAYEYVYHAKFKNCILIGQDLAFGEDGTTHSDGHIYGQTENGHNRSDEITEVLGYGGEKMVRTTLIWKLFKNFFETDIHYAAQENITTINATEGGARIEGALEIPFREAIDTYIDTTCKKSSICLHQRDRQDIEQDKKIVHEKIEAMLAYANKISKEVQETFLHVAKECEIIEKTPEAERYALLDFQRLADVMEEIDAIKAHFAEQIFADIFIDATQALMVHQEIEIATIQVRNVTTDDERRQLMIDWILIHRYWLFSLAGLVRAVIEAINMGLEMSIAFEKIQVIRVYAEGKECDILHVRDTDPLINTIYDLKKLCIEYVLDEKNVDKRKDLRFYYSDEVRSFEVEVHMPVRDDMHFNEFAFKNSLEATVDKEKIENLYEKGVIGFLATEENLRDLDFVEYIKELIARFPDITFKAFCFTEEQRNLAKSIVYQQNEIQVFIIKSVYDFLSMIEIYIGAINTNWEWEFILFCRKYSKNVATPKVNAQEKPIQLIGKLLEDIDYKKNYIRTLE